MRQHLLDLYEIQKIDLSIREQQQRQEALPARVRELDGTIAGLQAQVVSLTDRREAIAREAQNLRGVVESETQKIRKWESRLNDIRNQREYQALSRETEGSRRANRDADDKIGELLAQRDSVDQDIEALKGRLRDQQGEREQEQARVAGALDALAAEMQREQARRTALLPTVPKPMFRKYDAIRGRRMGIGLAPVSGGCCTGCNMRLPPQLYNTLQRATTSEQCPSCHRLIFWDQILPAGEDASDLAAAAAEDPPPANAAS